MRWLRIFALLSTVMLFGCGPIYDTTYTMKPPRSASGARCVQRCLIAKQQCQFRCQSSYQRCQAQNAMINTLAANLPSQRRQNQTTRSQTTTQKLGPNTTQTTTTTRTRGSSAGFQVNTPAMSCTQNCGCNDDYRSCFSACGGTIIPHKRCVMNCGKQ